jgi:hypothetical protein
MAKHESQDVVDTPASDVKSPKRLSTSFTAGEGAARSRLTILALRKANDTATVHVETTNIATKKTARGMTKKFDTFELATAAVDKLVKDAVQKGWQRTARSGGFKARLDAFTTLPTPPPSKGKK